MLRVALVLTAQFFAALLSAPPAMPAGEMAIPRPPAVLSPDLTEASIVPMKPGARQACIGDPAPRCVAFAPALGFGRSATPSRRAASACATAM